MVILYLVMPIHLNNSLFIHIPKTAGKTVSEVLVQSVEGAYWLGDPIFDAHTSPSSSLSIITMIREPVTWMTSLWHHRSRKGFNWHTETVRGQQPPMLEIECHANNYLQFMQNIADKPGVITRYTQHFIGNYERVYFARVEHMKDDLIDLLEQLDEPYSRSKLISACENIELGKGNYDVDCPDDLMRQIRLNEREFFGQYYELN